MPNLLICSVFSTKKSGLDSQPIQKSLRSNNPHAIYHEMVI